MNKEKRNWLLRMGEVVVTTLEPRFLGVPVYRIYYRFGLCTCT